jgi:hypothetical protein
LQKQKKTSNMLLLFFTFISLVLGQASLKISRAFNPTYAYKNQNPYVTYTFTQTSFPLAGYTSDITYFRDTQIAGLADGGATYTGECGRVNVIGSISWSYDLTHGLTINAAPLRFVPSSSAWVCFEFHLFHNATSAHYSTAFNYGTQFQLTNTLSKLPPTLTGVSNIFDAYSTPEHNGPGP